MIDDLALREFHDKICFIFIFFSSYWNLWHSFADFANLSFLWCCSLLKVQRTREQRLFKDCCVKRTKIVAKCFLYYFYRKEKQKALTEWLKRLALQRHQMHCSLQHVTTILAILGNSIIQFELQTSRALTAFASWTNMFSCIKMQSNVFLKIHLGCQVKTVIKNDPLRPFFSQFLGYNLFTYIGQI